MPAICADVEKIAPVTEASWSKSVTSMRSSQDTIAGSNADYAQARRLMEAQVTGGTWHKCVCKDGTDYHCKSKLGDGAACCGRSMPALCGEGNVDRTESLSTVILTFEPKVKVTGGENDWVTCTCEDASTYQCKNKNGGMDQGCCTRSMPAICARSDKFTTPITKGSRSSGDSISMGSGWTFGHNSDSRRLQAAIEDGWHVCTCKDGKGDLDNLITADSHHILHRH
jgi:hypothetical protein